jgi:putative transposase
LCSDLCYHVGHEDIAEDGALWGGGVDLLHHVEPFSCVNSGAWCVDSVSDVELLRRFKVLYPKPTKYQVASFAEIERLLRAGGDEASEVRQKLLARMGDLSEFMKTVKQRFSVWYNGSHQRYGTLWADRFKSVLVEGEGNPLQTMAAYIDLNSVRAGIVDDPKDYRCCSYAEAVANSERRTSNVEHRNEGDSTG